MIVCRRLTTTAICFSLSSSFKDPVKGEKPSLSLYLRLLLPPDVFMRAFILLLLREKKKLYVCSHIPRLCDVFFSKQRLRLPDSNFLEYSRRRGEKEKDGISHTMKRHTGVKRSH